MIQNQIAWFNPAKTIDFLNKEYKLASNIKNRQNRQSVERVLKILIEKLKICKSKNGLCCVAGIDSNNNEFIHVYEPIIPITKFIYTCDNKFDIDMLKSLFDIKTSTGHIVMISGDTTLIYSCNISQSDITFKLSNKIIGLLNKRMSRGGMSQNRIARLAEDSRLHYGTRIVESINKLVCDRLSSSIKVIGSKEITEMVKTSKILKVPIDVNIGSKWHSWNDPYEFLVSNKKEWVNIFNQISNSDEKKIENVLSLIKKDPDMLSFGKDINEKECEYIVSLDETATNIINKSKLIIVSIKSKFYGEFQAYKQIGKKYYK